MMIDAAEKWAKTLHGREYGAEISRTEVAQAKADGVLIIFGYSDDNIEFRGIVDEEVGAWYHTKIRLDKSGEPLPQGFDDDKEVLDKYGLLPAVEARYPNVIDAEWDSHGYSWWITSSLPQHEFDILEDGEKFCRGIVINREDLK
jgi:hypothetical protein